MLPALRLEPQSAFLAARHLSRLSCPEAPERSTTLDLEDPFHDSLGSDWAPNYPASELPGDKRRARRLDLLFDLDDLKNETGKSQ